MKVKFSDTVGAIGLFILGLAFLIYVIGALIIPEKGEQINFNITGITNAENATTLSSLHFECIKYCGNTMSDGTVGQYRCYEECAKLGSEYTPPSYYSCNISQINITFEESFRKIIPVTATSYGVRA